MQPNLGLRGVQVRRNHKSIREMQRRKSGSLQTPFSGQRFRGNVAAQRILPPARDDLSLLG